MKPDCILLYGIDVSPITKTAGVFRVATELRNHGYIVQCIDITAFNDETNFQTLIQILSGLITDKTLWIGLSQPFLDVTLEKSYIEKISEYFKIIQPKLKFIVGGSREQPENLYYEKLGFTIFKGYADETIIKYTDWCAGKIKTYDFLLPHVIGSEFLEFNQSKIDYQDADIILPNDPLPIEVSRGCIFKCKFCSFPLNGKKKDDHLKSYSVFKDELNRNYDLYGTTSYLLVDDTYNDSVDKVKKLYDEVYSQLNFKLELTAYLRCDLLMRFPDTIPYIKESGFQSVIFGIETINEKSAKSIGKGVPPSESFDFISDLKENEFKDIIISSGFILGLPYDNIDTLNETEEFILSDKNKLDSWTISPLIIRPNSLKMSYSQFELEYKKYNYYFDNPDPDRWKNDKNGLTYELCKIYAESLNQRSYQENKIKSHGFMVPWLRAIGVSKNDILTKPIKMLNDNGLDLLIEKKRTEYRNNLMNFLNISKFN